jgi:hypothetical protein
MALPELLLEILDPEREAVILRPECLPLRLPHLLKTCHELVDRLTRSLDHRSGSRGRLHRGTKIRARSRRRKTNIA